MSAPIEDNVTNHLYIKFKDNKESLENALKLTSAFGHGLIYCKEGNASIKEGILKFNEWYKITDEKDTDKLRQEFMNGFAHRAGWRNEDDQTECTTAFETWWGQEDQNNLVKDMIRSHFEKGFNDKQYDRRNHTTLLYLKSSLVSAAEWKAMSQKERRDHARKRKKAKKKISAPPSSPHCYIRSSTHA